jgi:CelD/BcsL family acetyltransferase involved in cellulose biosynthesis
MIISIISSLEELASLKPDWDILYNKQVTTTPFSGFDWTAIWWKYNSDRKKLYVFVVRDEAQKVIGIAPFCISIKNGSKTMRFLGYGNSDYLDILIEPGKEETCLSLILDHLYKNASFWDMLELNDIPESSPCFKMLQGKINRNKLAGKIVTSLICPYLHWGKTYQEYLSTKSSNFRYDLKRKMKRAQKLGAISFEILDNASGIQEFASIYEKRWEKKDTNATIRKASGQKLLEEAVQAWAEQKILKIPVLKLDGKIIAFCLGFIAQGRFYYYIPSFDPAYIQLSPGKLLVEYIIQNFQALGVQEIDFMKGEERYKTEWSDTFRQNFRVLLWNSRLCSRSYAGIYFAYLSFRNKARTSQLLRFLRFNALGYIKRLFKKPHTAPSPDRGRAGEGSDD